jgi:hypothetical protein
MSKALFRAGIFALIFAIGNPPAHAEERRLVEIDALVQQAAETLAAAKSFTVHAEKIFDVVLLAGPKAQHAGAIDIAVRRPDRFYVSYGDDFSSKELWYDGASLTIQDHTRNVHGVIPAGASIEETVSTLREQYGLFLPLAELFSVDNYRRYSASAGQRLYLGTSDVEGRLAHHILFTGERVDWQIWIDAGEVPLPLKIVVNQHDTYGQPQQTIVLSEWDLDASLPDKVFQAEINAGSVLATFLRASVED